MGAENCVDAAIKRQAARVPLVIPNNAEFHKVLRWMQPLRTYKPITGATQAAPCVLTVTAHAIPDGWPFWVESVKGMVELNRPYVVPADPCNCDSEEVKNKPYRATVRSANSIEINNLNALDFHAYLSGGTIMYFAPYDMAAGTTAELQIRSTASSSTALVTLTTENGGIVIDNVLKTITLIMTEEQCAAYKTAEAVYDLIITLPSNGPERIAYGPVTLISGVTRGP